MSVWLVVWVVLFPNQPTANIAKIPSASRCALASTALGNHVVDIDRLRSKEEMDGVDAGRVVAAVKDHQTFRDRSNKELVRDMARQQLSTLTSAFAYLAVAILVPTPGPRDTTVRHLPADVAEEAIDERNGAGLIAASERAEFGSVSFDRRRECEEALTARFTDTRNLDRLAGRHDRSCRVVVFRADQQLQAVDPPVSFYPGKENNPCLLA